MEVFVARNPIFDAGKVVHGYELKFKSGFDTYYNALCEDNESAKTNVDFMAFVNYGELTNNRPGLVNFSQSLLMRDFPKLLPKEKLNVGIEIPQSQCPQDFFDKCSALSKNGYSLVLNNVTLDNIDTPLITLAKFAKIDFSKVPHDDQKKILQILAEEKIKAIAYNLQAISDSTQALKWGYHFFHGEFFSQPALDTDQDLKNSKLAYFHILQEVNRPELSYDQIARIIKHDVALTYKLLRFINSAWFGLKYEIRSIKHALILLGPKEIKKWAALVAMSNTGIDKPKELLLRALTRARTAEQIALQLDMSKQAPEFFLMGMFSLIDALTDTPMEKALEKIPLNERITDTLLGHKTETYHQVYEVMIAYESADWNQLTELANQLGIDDILFPKFFREAWNWATNALRELGQIQ